MKRDFLKELELSDEVIEKIMAEHGKGIDAERKKAETLTAQRDEAAHPDRPEVREYFR